MVKVVKVAKEDRVLREGVTRMKITSSTEHDQSQIACLSLYHTTKSLNFIISLSLFLFYLPSASLLSAPCYNRMKEGSKVKIDLIVIGNPNSGKTSLIRRFIEGEGTLPLIQRLSHISTRPRWVYLLTRR